jgi:polar amino acid transport system substrate-binding protein
MNSKNKIIYFFLIVFLTISVCQSAWSAETAPPLKLQNILKAGTLRVGVSLFTPWVFKDKKGKLTGFEIDVANKISKDMGVTPSFLIRDWEKLIPALLNDEIDIIIAGMAITPQRALKVNFSQPYATAGTNLATNIALTKDIKNVDELNQKKIKIGVVAETVSQDLAKRIFKQASIISYKSPDEVKKDLVSGKIHAYMESKPIPLFISLEHPDKVDLPLSAPLLITKAGFAIKKGDGDFLNFLNSWIIAREADTWLKSTHNYWFRTLKWRQEPTQ